MKKYLIMISAFVLTTVSTNQLIESMISTNILKPIIKNENKYLKEFTQLNDEKEIDFNKVENYFKDEKNKTNNKFNGISSSDTLKTRNPVDNAFAKSLEYTKEFKAKNMSLNEIITKFQNEIPKFKTVFERELNKQPKTNTFNFKSIYENKLPKFNNKEEQKLKLEAAEFWNKVNNIRTVLATSVAIAAIIAAGFWAVAWLGGISVPWAVAATTVTAAMGVMLSALNIYLHKTNPYMDNILRGISITGNSGLLIYEFVSTVIKVFTISTIVLSATSIIMPVFTAVSATVISLYYWVDKTDIFKQLDGNNNFQSNLEKINNSNNNEDWLVNFNIDNDTHNGSKSPTYIHPKIQRRDYELLDWTKYASSIDEFEKNIKGIILVNSKAFAGDHTENVLKENIIISKSQLGGYDENREFQVVENIYDPWHGWCYEKDKVSFLSWYHEEKILIRWILYIQTNCSAINYASIKYKSANIIL